MSLQQFFDSYHLDTDCDDYDDRFEIASCFVCDAQEHPQINASIAEIYAFANRAFSVRL